MVANFLLGVETKWLCMLGEKILLNRNYLAIFVLGKIGEINDLKKHVIGHVFCKTKISTYRDKLC